MARDEALLFQQLQTTGWAIRWVEEFTGPQAILDASELIAEAGRTLAKGKQRPWSNPQEHVLAAHRLGGHAFVAINAVLRTIQPVAETDYLVRVTKR
jgi:hypothetical protein